MVEDIKLDGRKPVHDRINRRPAIVYSNHGKALNEFAYIILFLFRMQYNFHACAYHLFDFVRRFETHRGKYKNSPSWYLVFHLQGLQKYMSVYMHVQLFN